MCMCDNYDTYSQVASKSTVLVTSLERKTFYAEEEEGDEGGRSNHADHN